jgi:hypothetical protein
MKPESPVLDWTLDSDSSEIQYTFALKRILFELLDCSEDFTTADSRKLLRQFTREGRYILYLLRDMEEELKIAPNGSGTKYISPKAPATSGRRLYSTRFMAKMKYTLELREVLALIARTTGRVVKVDPRKTKPRFLGEIKVLRNLVLDAFLLIRS